MGVFDAIKNILGVCPVNIGKIGAEVANSRAPKDINDISQPDEPEYEITEEYKKVDQLLKAGVPAILVGGFAGTGKSTLIEYLRSQFKGLVVTAPTGVAALNVRGQTLHSLFYIPPRLVDVNSFAPQADKRPLRLIKILVIDEISMVRPDVLDVVDLVLRKAKENPSPFGGAQLVMIGDLYQLPPVVKSSERGFLSRLGYESEFFFSSKALGRIGYNMAPLELKKVFRQRDTDFIQLLCDLRIGKNVEFNLTQLNLTCARNKREGSVELCTTNAIADGINSKELALLPGEEHSFDGVITGKFKIRGDKLPAPIKLNLKIGARVMFTKNGKGWVNGTLGRVEAFSGDAISVKDENGGIHAVKREKWDNYAYSIDNVSGFLVHKSIGSYTQFPLMLSWALTIHKSQSKTLSRIHVNLGPSAFASGQVYVALSRVKAIKDITLERPIARSDIRVSRTMREFDTRVFGFGE